MVYYNQTMRAYMQDNFPKVYDALETLASDYGVNAIFDTEMLKIINIEICRLSFDGRTTLWTHYANINPTSGGAWELNEQFCGANEREMYIYGVFKTVGAALRNLIRYGTNATTGRKPKEIYY